MGLLGLISDMLEAIFAPIKVGADWDDLERERRERGEDTSKTSSVPGSLYHPQHEIKNPREGMPPRETTGS